MVCVCSLINIFKLITYLLCFYSAENGQPMLGLLDQLVSEHSSNTTMDNDGNVVLATTSSFVHDESSSSDSAGDADDDDDDNDSGSDDDIVDEGNDGSGSAPVMTLKNSLRLNLIMLKKHSMLKSGPECLQERTYTSQILEDVINIVNTKSDQMLKTLRRRDISADDNAINMLWIGCKDILHVVYVALSFQKFPLKHSKLKIWVVEDITTNLTVPHNLDESISIHVVRENFLLYKSIRFYDIIYSSVKSTLSLCFKFKLFALAHLSWRGGSPLLFMAHPHLFVDANEETSILSNKQNKDVIVESRHTSYIISAAGESFWGSMTNGSGINMIKNLKLEVTREVDRQWYPGKFCSPFVRLLPPNSTPLCEMIMRNEKCPETFSLTLFMRTCILTFDSTFLMKMRSLFSSDKANIYEVYQAAYFKVELMYDYL
jgi:hypothetical protein